MLQLFPLIDRRIAVERISVDHQSAGARVDAATYSSRIGTDVSRYNVDPRKLPNPTDVEFRPESVSTGGER
jgi:hypothetical protein